MTRKGWVIASVLSFAAAATAQNGGAPTVSTEVRQNYMRTKDLIMRAAAKMPDEAYSFRATPEVRTFAQVLNHIAEAQAMVCGGINGQLFRVDTTKTAKSDVITELAKSFAACDRAYDSINESNITQVGGAGFLGGTLVGRLYGNLNHDNEMYGTIVVYLRLQGIVPPSSERRSR